MTYRLICKGRLVEGTDEVKAVIKLRKLTGLSTEEVAKRLLSGKPVKLKSSDDRTKIDVLYQAFSKAGLDVEMVEDFVPTPAAPTEADVTESSIQASAADSAGSVADTEASGPVTSAPPLPRRHSPIWISVAALLLLVAGLLAYGWYWLRAPLPAGALVAEQALADGRLVAIGHVNVEKVVQLQRYFLGELDAAALPIEGRGQDLLSDLFDGSAQLRERLGQLFFAVHAGGDEGKAETVLLLSGRFDRDAIMQSLSTVYRIEASADGDWAALHEQAAKKADVVCPEEASNSKRPGRSPLYLKVTPDWLLLVSETAYGDRLQQRLSRAASAEQDLTAWQAYRQDKLASLTVFSTQQSSTALTGFAGMAARQAAKEASEVSSVAAGIGVDIGVPGLNLNLLLGSADAAWRQSTVQEVQQGIDKLRQDSRRVSPTLAGVFNRITAQSDDEAVAIDVALDSELLDDLGQVIQEGFASLFSVEVRDANQPAGEQPDQIDTRPTDYSASADLVSLPELKIESYQQAPLYRRGAFGIDLERIRLHDDTGGLALNLQGTVALPKTSKPSNSQREADLTLMVTAVEDSEGRDLLRDERCVKKVFYGGGFNHQPSQGTLVGDKGRIAKELRLKKGVKVEDIDRIKGQIKLSAPVAVRRFQLPLQAGESIEFEGMRFYLSAVKERSVSYQLSGATDRFLELRALNAEGKPLKRGWRMGDAEGGRASQQFEGRVQGLELYVAERVAEHQVHFVLRDLFQVKQKETDNLPAWLLAPAAMDYPAWQPYQKLDMSALTVDPKKWHVFDKNKAPIADRHWPGLSLYITHTPKQWGNNPQAHVYFPMLPELPGVLSALGYRILEPVEADGPSERYKRVHYPYYANSRERVIDYKLGGMPLALNSWQLQTGLKENESLKRLKGELIYRLPLATRSTMLDLKGLWSGATVDGVTVTLTEVSRGVFPGYGLKIAGELSKLVNLHGLDGKGKRVIADPVNYQDDGYWTMTLPFGMGIEQVELVLATEQKVLRYPFDLKPVYPD